MKILVLTDRFIPEISAVSFRTMDHAKVWIEQGHEVTVVTCAPNLPHGKVFPGYRNRWYQEETIEGVRVIRVFSYMAPNAGFARRIVDYTSYMVSAILFCRRYPPFDVVLATSPPFFVAIAGFMVSRLRRRPWVFEVRDLWPDSIRAVGASRSRLLKLVEHMELYLYRHAQRVIAVTRSFKEHITARGIRPDTVDVVFNGVDTALFTSRSDVEQVRAELGIERGMFLAGYIGTTGMAHGLETLLDCAERCKDRPEIRFLIMGEGAERAKLEQDARRRCLSNVQFRDFVPHQRMPDYLAALDVSVVHLRRDPLFRTVIPSKIFESMALATPIIMAVEGEGAEIVAGAGAGVCIPSGDAEAMAQTAVQLSQDRAACRHMGQCGKAATQQKYSRRSAALAALCSLAAAAARKEKISGKGKTHE